MNVETETEAAQFLSREYLFQIFGIMSLECISLQCTVQYTFEYVSVFVYI
jgi:hypothetical protein